MFSFDASFLNTDQFISQLGSNGELFQTNIVTAPVNIELKFVCAFCENTYEQPNGVVKSREMKQLEGVAVEHFKRKVLCMGEESLGDASLIFSLDEDGSRYRKLLNSLMLCNGCIVHFAKSEQAILKDQLKYLEKITGMRKMDEIFNDPWLDLKRLAYHKLRSQESTIKEKLEWMEKMFASEDNPLNSNLNGCVEVESSLLTQQATTSAVAVAASSTSTTAQQMLLTTTVSIPADAPNGVIIMDVSDKIHGKPSDASCLQSNTTTLKEIGPNETPNSRISSCGASPQQGKDDASNEDSSSRANDECMDTDTNTVTTTESHVQQGQNLKDQIQDEHESKESPANGKDEAAPGSATPNKADEEERKSEKGISSMIIPTAHMSPIVRLKHLSSSSKTPSPPASRAGSTSSRLTVASKTVVKNLGKTVGELLNDMTNRKAKKPENVNSEDTNEGQDESNVQDKSNQMEQQEQDNQVDIQSDLEEYLSLDETEGAAPVSKTNPIPKTIVSDEKTGKQRDTGSVKNKASNKMKGTGKQPSKVSADSSQNASSNDDQSDETDSDTSSIVQSTSQKTNRKRKSKSGKAGGNVLKLGKKMKMSKSAKLSSEDELILKSPAKKSSEGKNKSKSFDKTPASCSKTSSETSLSKSEKKSNNSSFASPLPPAMRHKKSKEHRRDSSNISDAENTRRKSDNSFTDKQTNRSGSRRSSESQQKQDPLQTPTTNYKKVFKIGNRYMTDPSSSSDSGDSDYQVTPSIQENSDSE